MTIEVFSVTEHILTYDTVEDGELNPWWYSYQPVSYRLSSRGGTKKEFKSMINTCRQKGVRVYTNAVINHMAGDGNDMYLDHRINVDSCIHWGPKSKVMVLHGGLQVGNIKITLILGKDQV